MERSKLWRAQRETEWHRVSVFSEGLVKVVKNYVKKGSKLYVEGQLQTRKWTDKDGAEKYSTEVVLQGFGAVITMLDAMGDAGAVPSSPRQSPAATALVDDEIPF